MIGRKETSIFLVIFTLLILTHVGLSSPTLQITVFTDKPNYGAGENIFIYGEVKADGSPIVNATVGLEVLDPSSSPIISRALTTDVLGKYSLGFNLSSQALLGTYTVYVSCSYGGERATDTTSFNLGKASTFTVTVNVGRSTYKVEEQILVYGNVTFGDIPVVGAFVAVEVQDPKGTTVLMRVPATDSNGFYNLTFQLPSSASLGDYTVYVSASYQNQQATANTSFQLKRRFLADINDDGKVNIEDVYLMARAWHSYPGHPRWNPKCDLDGNEIVNILDVVILAREYGR
jgi:uncharacterized protein YfaS (alpha-2-macroglobulin family)